jgi:hypothetical protein
MDAPDLNRALAAAALLVFLGGCTSGTGPGPIEDEYALARIGDARPPGRVGNETWIADTIRFHADGAWSRVAIVQLHAEGASPDPVRRTMDGFVTRVGSRIVLDFECNDVILRSCVAPDTVEVAGDELVRRPNRYSVGDVVTPLFHYEPVAP